MASASTLDKELKASLKGKKVHRFAALGREAINMPVQGTAAEILKRAMIAIDQDPELTDCMVLTVHDELVFDVPEEETAVMMKLIRRQMEHSLELSVPVKVTIKIGNNWLQLKEIS